MPVSNEHVPGRHVLVTGGAGYLGSVLVPELLRLGYEVSVIDLQHFGAEGLRSVASHPSLHVHRADVAELDGLPRRFHGIDAVVHLASISNDPTCDLDPNVTIRTNYLATTALARRARAEGVQQFIYTSSCSVYGASSSRVLDELSHTGPVTLYALTKLASERELLELAGQDFRVTSLRLATLFGLSPRMRFDLAVNLMTKRLLQGQNIVVNGAGEQYRPFVHVRDAVDAILLVLRADPAVVRREIFNVGADHLNFTIRRLAETISTLGVNPTIEVRPKSEDVRSYRVRFQKIRDTLGLAPRFGIEDAFAEIKTAFASGALGTMDEEKYYNLTVMKRIHKARAESPWAAVSSSVDVAQRKSGAVR